MRRAKVQNTTIQILSDPNLNWISQYAITNIAPWGLCIVLIDEHGIVQSLERNIDPKQVCRIVSEAVQLYK
jgi:hypothetical protein